MYTLVPNTLPSIDLTQEEMGRSCWWIALLFYDTIWNTTFFTSYIKFMHLSLYETLMTFCSLCQRLSHNTIHTWNTAFILSEIKIMHLSLCQCLITHFVLYVRGCLAILSIQVRHWKTAFFTSEIKFMHLTLCQCLITFHCLCQR